MTAVWWQCRICADELYDSQHAMEHRLTTGHNNAAVVTNACPPGSGSTPEGRRRAREIYEQARREAASTCNPAAEEAS